MTTLPTGFNSQYPDSVWSVNQLVDLINAVIALNIFSGGTIAGATINSSSVGASVPSSGAFTTLAASGAATVGTTLAVSGTSTVAAVTASGTITANGILTAANAVALSPASHNVVLSPTGTGVVTINPATLGSMDKVTIGGTTPAAATVTALTATGAAVLSNASVKMTALPTADPHVVGQLWADTGVVTVSAG
jgi:hypothetical protein